jgi:hypothetical protein
MSFIGVFSGLFSSAEPVFLPKVNYLRGISLQGGGLIGGTVHAALHRSVGVFTPVIAAIAILLFTSFLFGKTPAELFRAVFSPLSARLRDSRRERLDRQQMEKKLREEERMRLAEERAKEKYEIKREKIRLKEENKKQKEKRKNERCAVNLESGEAVTEPAPEDWVADDEVRIQLPLEEEKRLEQEKEEEIRQKILAEEMRIARIKRKKLRLAKEKKEKKARKKAASTNPTGAVAEKPNLLENLACVFAVIRDVNYRTNGKLYFRVNRFRITVATDDAAKTGLLYGAVVQSAAYVFQWIETHFNHLHRKNGAMEILPDYTAQKSSAELDFSCSLTFLRALIIYLSAMGTYETKKSEVLAKRKNKTTLGSRLSKLFKKA